MARLQATAERAGVDDHPGGRFVLDAGRCHRSRRVRRHRAAGPTRIERAGSATRRVSSAPAACVRRAGQLRIPRPGRRAVRADRDGRALPVHRRTSLDGRARAGRPRASCATGSSWRTPFAPGRWRRRSSTIPAAFYGPLVTATFATQRRAATRLGLQLGWARRPDPRARSRSRSTPWTIAVLEQSAGSTAVVNDLADVVEWPRRRLRTRVRRACRVPARQLP